MKQEKERKKEKKDEAALAETNLNSTLRFKFQMTCRFSLNVSSDW